MNDLDDLAEAARGHEGLPILERPMHKPERSGAEWVIIIAAGILLGSLAVQLVDCILLDYLVEHLVREIRVGLR